MIMHRYVLRLTVVCAAVILVTIGAAFATDTSDLARAAFQANERREFPVAIGLFNKAIADGQLSKKQRGLLLFGRGTAYQQLGMKEAALTDLDGVVALLPDFPGGYVYRALIWTAERRYEEAVTDLQEAHQLVPNDPSVLLNLANLYAQTQRFRLALENYDRAIRLRPDFDTAYYNRAGAYMVNQDFAHAIADFDKAIELRPTFADAFANRGALHLANGNVEKALADLNSAIELAPRNVTYHDARANAYLVEARYSDALADFDEALQIDPGNIALYFGRGRANLFLENMAAAIDDLQIAVRLRPTDANAAIWLHIARLHAKAADENEFTTNAARVKRDVWPGAVLDLYLGALTPTEMLAKAQEGTEDSERRLCEAQLYAADYGIHRGALTEALDIMKRVVSRCRSFALVYASARAELNLAGL
jgi:tetratricopeptide (TPR) repeat protein